MPIADVTTAEKYNKINLICKKELGKIFKEQLGKNVFGCKAHVSHLPGKGCSCHCNDWKVTKEDVKKAGVSVFIVFSFCY